MKLKFIFLGKKGSSQIDFMINKYLKRLNSYIQTECFYVNNQSSFKSDKKILLLKRPNDCLIILDERGLELNTLEYSRFLQKNISNYSSLIFIVGGAHGVSDYLTQKANHLIALSKMTLPHLMARLMIVEQTYRSFTIFNNHPYHHE